ncbi:MAG TPA: protoglobin domain-containing protein, partial [Sphingomonadales bacterium]
MSSASMDGAGRLDFLEIDADTVALLREFREHLVPALPGIVDQFYDKLRTAPELRPLLGTDETVKRLKLSQIGHWKHLFNAQFDEAYFRRAKAIGEAHHRVNLSPRWYIAAYALMLNHIVGVIEQVYGNDPAKTRRVTAAVNKIVLLDMDLAISVYIE